MRTTDIAKLNEANFVLRHFVDLSAKLLPFLDQLQRLKDPTMEQLRNKNKIIEVFENYSFDTETSETLINSNILELIKRSYENISQTSYFLKPGQKNGCLHKFLREYRRLSEDWYHTSYN